MRWVWMLMLAAVVAPAAAQGDDALHALARWRRGYLSGAIDVTSSQALPDGWKLPDRIAGRGSVRDYTPIQALRLLVEECAAIGSEQAVHELLELAAPGFRQDRGGGAGDVIVRAAAEEGLVASASTVARGALLAAAVPQKRRTRPDDVARRCAAATALGGTGDPVYWPALTELLGDEAAPVRAAAATSLGLLESPRAIESLLRALRTESEGLAIQAMVVALADLLEVASRRGQLDGMHVLEAARAACARIGDTGSWRVDADLVRFLDRHRIPEAVPVLIDLLERHGEGAAGRGRQRGEQSPVLAAEAHRVLRKMTGAVLGADDVDSWRQLWQTEGAALVQVQNRRQAQEADPRATSAGTFFGIPVLGERVVFVLDVSGSMQAPAPQPELTVAPGGPVPRRIDVAAKECWDALRKLPDHAHFTVIVFSSSVHAWRDDLVPASAANKAAVRRFLRGLGPDGSTNLWGGLKMALAMRTRVGASRYREPVDEVFLLSDGYPSSGELTDGDQILSHVGDINRHAKVRIHTVFIGLSHDPMDDMVPMGNGGGFMHELAVRNGGTSVQK